MMLTQRLRQIPAKADVSGACWLPFWIHSMDTAEIIVRLLNEWLPEHFAEVCGCGAEELRKLCRFLALVHDLGKLTPVFAARITESLPELRQKLEASGLQTGSPKEYQAGGKSPHARAGEVLLLEAGCPPGIAAVVGAHQGKPQESSPNVAEELDGYERNYYGLQYKDSESGRLWAEIRREWLSAALEEAGYISAAAIPDVHQPVQILLTGLLIMADWIASNTAYFPLISVDSSGEPEPYPERAQLAWEKLDLPGPWEPQTFIMDEDRFDEVFRFAPNPVQAMMLHAANEGSGGIYILEAQMGVGKTEAALAAAEILASKCDCGGVFFGLPTQATANGLFGRLAAWANTQSEDTRLAIRLAHGMAELNEEYRAVFHGSADGNEDGDEEDRLIVHPWFGGRKQALLADFVIGTVDQLLLAALKQKHVMLRHLGLAGKVVILDECHAYDAYMNQYLERALNWLGAYRIPVIMLSATLPEARRAALVEAYLNGPPEREPVDWRIRRAYPLLTWTDGRSVCQDAIPAEENGRRVSVRKAEPEQLISILRTAVSEGGCCGVIVNTVRYAQELTDLLKDAIPGADRLLLHSRFVAPDRAEREKTLLSRIGKGSAPEQRRGLIVVGTQVLEQSLDIDFDLLITQLCPMDLLLQRIGRLHRHARSRPEGLREAVCYVLPADEGSRAVYGDWLLLRTGQLLPDRLTLPQSIPELVQETYREPDETVLRDEECRKAWEENDQRLELKKRKARSYRITAPPGENARRRKTIDGWLNAEHPADGQRGEAAVRDGASGITVLAMQEHTDGRITFLPWQHGGIAVSAACAPDDETARWIAGQRLTLPASFSSFGREGKTIEELEALNRNRLPEWQNSGWLRGELVLLFDEDLKADLCGQTLVYLKELGLANL